VSLTLTITTAVVINILLDSNVVSLTQDVVDSSSILRFNCTHFMSCFSSFLKSF